MFRPSLRDVPSKVTPQLWRSLPEQQADIASDAANVTPNPR